MTTKVRSGRMPVLRNFAAASTSLLSRNKYPLLVRSRPKLLDCNPKDIFLELRLIKVCVCGGMRLTSEWACLIMLPASREV